MKKTKLIPPLFSTGSMSCHVFQLMSITAYIYKTPIHFKANKIGFVMWWHTCVLITIQYRT